MQLTQLNTHISNLGLKLLARIKYGFTTSYDPYDFLSTLSEKGDVIKQKTYHTLYKKIK